MFKLLVTLLIIICLMWTCFKNEPGKIKDFVNLAESIVKANEAFLFDILVQDG